MKRIDPPARLFAAVLATGMMLLAPQLRAENVPQVVQVIRVEGLAQWSTDSKNWVALNTGDVLKPGAVIRTSDKSLVDVVLGDRDATGTIPVSMSSAGTISSPSGAGGGEDEATGNVIRIFSMTVMGVDKLLLDRTGMDEVSDTQLDLRAGQILVNVKKLSKQSRYEVRIPNGVAGIRGSATLISSSGFIDTLIGDTIVSIFGGNGSQTTRDVPSGHHFDPGTGLVTPMSPADLKRLQQILDELRPFIKAIEKLLEKDHTIIFCSPLDGTAAH